MHEHTTCQPHQSTLFTMTVADLLEIVLRDVIFACHVHLDSSEPRFFFLQIPMFRCCWLRWRLGVLLYEFCVGVPPFRGVDTDELFKRIIDPTSTLRFPPFLSPETKDLISKVDFTCSTAGYLWKPHNTSGSCQNRWCLSPYFCLQGTGNWTLSTIS